MQRVTLALRLFASMVCPPVGAYAAGSSLYLLGLALAAAAPRRGTPRSPATDLPSFDVVVPAHDEELTIRRLFRSVDALDYPRDRVRLHVVADNCTDRTADVARTLGARVYERQDGARVGKGFALEFAIAQVMALPGRPGDGVVIVDADSELSSNFLRELAAHLESGASVIQGYYSVANADDSPVSMLRYTALCLYNFLRPSGRANLGLSAGLRGNGMCFSRAALAEVGWRAHGLTEDVEQHYHVLARGMRVSFAPDAIVRAEMPSSLRHARAQNARWERGRLEALASDVPRLLALAARRADAAALDAALEQVVAPLSVCFAAALATIGLGVAARSRAWFRAGVSSAIALTLYVIIGLRLARAPGAAYRALAAAPVYAAWKCLVWSRAIVRPPGSWRRTERLAELRLLGRATHRHPQGPLR